MFNHTHAQYTDFAMYDRMPKNHFIASFTTYTHESSNMNLVTYGSAIVVNHRIVALRVTVAHLFLSLTTQQHFPCRHMITSSQHPYQE